MPLYLFNYNWTRISAELLICYHHQVGIGTVLYSNTITKYVCVCFESYLLVSVECYKVLYLTFTAKFNRLCKKVSLQSVKNTRPFVQCSRGLNYNLSLWGCEVHIVYSNTYTCKSQKNRDRSPCIKPGPEPTNARVNPRGLIF